MIGSLGKTGVIAGCFSAILLLSPIEAVAQQTTNDLNKIEQKLSEEQKKRKQLKQAADQLRQDVRKLQRQTVSVARQMQEREALASNLEIQLDELRAGQEQRRQDLKNQRLRLSGTLAALSRMPASPEQIFFLHPGEPKDAVHSAMLLKSAVPALREEARSIREELVALTTVEKDIGSKLIQLREAEIGLLSERKRMENLLKEKKRLADQAKKKEANSQKRIQALVKKAKSLKDLISKLERTRPKARPQQQGEEEKSDSSQEIVSLDEKPEGLKPFPENGPVTAPVVGRLTQRYGQDLGFGQTAKGVRVATRSSAQIIAPHDGQVVFSGPFRDHGLILIIEHPGGYHTVLAGFDRVDVVVGQWLIAGEPVGSMGSASSGKNPELYVELRRDGRPVNPLNWFSAGNIKVHG